MKCYHIYSWSKYTQDSQVLTLAAQHMHIATHGQLPRKYPWVSPEPTGGTSTPVQESQP